MDTIKFTKYESIIIPYTFTDDDGTPLALPEKIESDIANQEYKHVLRLDVVRHDEANGIFYLKTDQVIDVGKYIINIFFTSNGIRTASPRFYLQIENSPTVPEGVV